MKKFIIQNRKGLKIVGEFYSPKNPIGLAFIEHGLGGFKEQLHVRTLSNVLFLNDYIVINFDATNSIGESEGKYEDATMQNHYEDLVDVIEWSKTQGWYNEPFILAGHSLGGFSVAKYAEEYPEKVKAVFPYAAVYSGEDSFEASKKFKPGEIEEWKENGVIYRTSSSKPDIEMKLPWSHMEERLTHNLKTNANKITSPVLFVVGENDTSCPPYQQENFSNLLPKDTKREFHIIKGAPHTFKTKEDLEQLEFIFDKWIKKLK